MRANGNLFYGLCGVGGLCCVAALIVFTSVWLEDRDLGNSVSLAMSPLGIGIGCFLAADRLRFWRKS